MVSSQPYIVEVHVEKAIVSASTTVYLRWQEGGREVHNSKGASVKYASKFIVYNEWFPILLSSAIAISVLLIEHSVKLSRNKILKAISALHAQWFNA